jgi:hypothetical protein
MNEGEIRCRKLKIDEEEGMRIAGIDLDKTKVV